jgi:trehalose-phosphatase
MSEHPIGVSTPTPVLSAVWGRITSSPRRLLMLDYDGTLAPLRPERERAVPSQRARDALRAVATLGETVVVVSGRPVQQLAEFLRGIHVDLVGEHGWEELTAGGVRREHPVPQTASARLGLAYRAAAACGWRGHLEVKRASVVLHTRGMTIEAARTLEQHCRELWTRFFERDGLRIETIDGGLELRATQRGKGTMAWEILQREPRDTLPVYLGDDIGDEHAFRVLRPLGVTIRIGRPHLPTAAEWRLGSVDDVASFLEHWKTVVARR